MSSAISIAMLMGNMGEGGVEAVVMNYLRELARKDIHIDIILHKNSSFPQRRELEALNVQFHAIPSYARPFAYHKALLALFRQRRYAIVHAHVSTMNLFPLLAAWKAGVPVRICHNHSTAHWGEGIKTLLKFILRFPARLFATDYFACGEYSGRWMFGDRLVEAGRVFILPSAIDGKAYAFQAEARNRVRRDLGLEESCFAVGHVGRFVYQKNHGFLLNIFAAVKRQRPDSVLLLIGEGPLRPRLAEKAESLGISGSVRFLGTRDDLGAWYSAMDVLVLPSFYEGLPLVAVEAQANGLPCLLSTNITKEALLADNAAMLSLEQSPEVWVAGALASSRRDADFPAAFAIEEQAGSLYTAYRHFARRALGPQWDTAVIRPELPPRPGVV
jgi:glycosyltransferase EpsF